MLSFRKTNSRKIAAMATSLAAVAAFAVPAGAAETDLTLTLTNNGLLSISAPASAAAETSVDPLATTATFTIDDVLITDTRPLPGLFTATAASTDLTAAVGGGAAIPATTMLWTTGTVTNSADVLVPAVGGPGGSLGLPAPAVIAVGLGLGTTGASSYELDGNLINVPIPGGQLPGVYTGVLTTSVS